MRLVIVVICLLLCGCQKSHVTQRVEADPGGRLKVSTGGYNSGWTYQSNYVKTVFCEAGQLDSVLVVELKLAEKALEKMP